MSDSVTEMMFAAAVTQAEQIAVNEMARDLAKAEHIRQAMDLINTPRVADREPGLELVERGTE